MLLVPCRSASLEEMYSIDAKRTRSKGYHSLPSASRSERGRRVRATTWSGNWNADVRVVPGSAGFRNVTINRIIIITNKSKIERF